MLAMNKEKVDELGIDKVEVLKAISDSSIIKEVLAFKDLGKLVTNQDENNLSIAEILQMVRCFPFFIFTITHGFWFSFC